MERLAALEMRACPLPSAAVDTPAATPAAAESKHAACASAGEEAADVDAVLQGGRQWLAELLQVLTLLLTLHALLVQKNEY
jgi:hypothetical protein